MIENILISFATFFMSCAAVVFFHEIGHLLYLELSHIKHKISIKKAAIKIEIQGPITDKQMKRCLGIGLLMGLIPVFIVGLYSFILFLGTLTFYAIAANNDRKKLNKILEREKQ